MSQDKYTKLARGQDCTIRIPDCCCFDPATTVPCHFRLAGLSGIGLKPMNIHVAFGCHKCHERVDHDKSPEAQLAFAHGVFRSQAIMVRAGILKL